MADLRFLPSGSLAALVPPAPDALVVLRQGGLRDDLLHLAWDAGLRGWLGPEPSTFAELPSRLGGRLPPAADGMTRRAVLEAAARKFPVLGGRAVAASTLRALDALVGELVGEGIHADRLHAALEARAGRDAFERRRDEALVGTLRRYAAALTSLGLRDPRDGLVRTAHLVRAAGRDAAAGEALRHRLGAVRRLVIVGLADLRGGWRTLLPALAACEALDVVEVRTDAELDLPGAGSAAGPARAMAPPPSVTCIECADPDREHDAVAERIRALLETAPDPARAARRIAVVAREARPAVDLALAALARAGVPATARRRLSLAEVPAVRAVRALLVAAAEGWTRRGLAALADQPLLETGLDRRALDAAGFRRLTHGLDAWAVALPAHAASLERLRPFDGAQPLGARLDHLLAMLRDDTFGVRRRAIAVPAERFDVVRLDLAGLDRLAGALADWRRALDAVKADDAPQDAPTFLAECDALIAGETVAVVSGPERGVQVLEALAAAYRDFDHVFLVGLADGAFPRRAPRSPLLGEAERAHLAAHGIALGRRDDWERREDELFAALQRAARISLVATWPRVDEVGRETGPSRYADELVALAGGEPERRTASVVWSPAARLAGGAASVRTAARAVRVERLRETGLLSPWNGALVRPATLAWLAEQGGDTRPFSPTVIEEYAKCPWAYLARRLLGLDTRDEPDGDVDARLRGTLLHDVLAMVYAELGASDDAPLSLGDGHLAALPALVREAVERTVRRDERTAGLDEAARTLVSADLYRTLDRYLRTEIAYNAGWSKASTDRSKTPRTGVVRHEVEVARATFDHDGVRFTFRGRVDRLERVTDPRLDGQRFSAIVDYKSSSGGVPGHRDLKDAHAEGLLVQLTLYHHALLQAGEPVGRSEYRVLGGARPTDRGAPKIVAHRLDLVSVTKAGVEADAEAEARYVERLGQVAAHVTALRAGRFPADPAPSQGCPGHCPALTVCRVSGGPRTEHR
ncbi:MAG: PD-(D/E)XK nuclease family protein [Gemmatimonadales bacterium]|nr:PD-(D/E)XK nuclease family protein [Gemmatimonadales bacterium]